MELKHLATLLAVLCFGIQTVPVRGQDEAVNQSFLRWFRYSYDIPSSYPYLKELPDWSKIPTLLEWVNPDGGDAGTQVALSQLVALARVNFSPPQLAPAGTLETAAYYRYQKNAAWGRWWKSVGQPYPEQLRTRGQRSEPAWKQVTRGEDHPLPEYKVTIPEAWVLKAFYHAGDYDGKQSEALTLRRSTSNATLIRAVRKSTRGKLEWEQWGPLSTGQADTFALALAYAIDHPWLLKPKNGSRQLEGRKLSLYYPGFRYQLTDLQNNVWWNDDPWHWHGGTDYADISMNIPGLGSACLLIWRSFPESEPATAELPTSGHWRTVKMPNATVLQELTDDLVLRGEIIEILSKQERISDALEALAEFGTPNQLPALQRLERELRHRLESVETLLTQDQQLGHLRLTAGQLLTNAATAKAAIQQRHALWWLDTPTIVILSGLVGVAIARKFLARIARPAPRSPPPAS